MGGSQQRKGRNGELELAHTLQEYGFDSVKAGMPVSYGRTPDVTGLRGIHVECKRVERLNVSEAMRQAVSDSRKFRDGMPTVFHRKDNEEWLCTMRLSDWIRLYEAKHKLTENEIKRRGGSCG